MVLNQKSPSSMLDICALRHADILVTRSRSAMSRGIQLGTCSVVSHVLVMVDPFNCIEATSAGVQERKLSVAIHDAEQAFVLRHEKISFAQCAQVIKTLKSSVGRSYDGLGAIRSAVASGCNFARYSPFGVGIIVLDDAVKALQGGHDKAFYCSELVVRAFYLAGAPISKTGAHGTTPGALLTSEFLRLTKVIK